MRDGEGKTLAVGRLDAGKPNDNLATFPKTYRCVFSFSLDDVPDVSFYSVEVGRRGALTYSLAQMAAASWTVSFTIGR
jgi:hypothetical protein